MTINRNQIRVFLSSCLISVIFGMTLGFIGLSAGKGTFLWSLAYITNSPAIIMAEAFLNAIGKVDAFQLIVIAVMIYWMLIGIAVAGIFRRIRKVRINT